MLTPHVYLAPHRPTLALDRHRGHRTPMIEALSRAAERIAADSPATIVALTARWNTDGPFRVDDGVRHRTLTDYVGLGVEVRYDCDGHPALAHAVVEAGQKAGLRVVAARRGVDSGVTVPLGFLVPSRAVRVVPLSLPDAGAEACRAWGAALRGAIDAWPERVAFIAGGVLSFNEHAWNLKREVPEALAFDQATLDALARGAWDEVGVADRRALARARPEARLRHLEVLRGLLGERASGATLYHECATGIGAALVEFDATPPVVDAADSAASG
ncbi:MAG: hypothetical protein HYR73_06315 [Candidatus Eisenbacteria bacterium]|nr:hypothetical protein [Candidatus Eisenbacteria bacterium]